MNGVVWARRASRGRTTMHVCRHTGLDACRGGARCGRLLEGEHVDAGSVEHDRRCQGPGCRKAWPAQAQLGGGYQEAA